jgi:hypothetical protein
LNFRNGAVLVKVVIPAIGKAYKTLRLAGQHEQALSQRDPNHPVPNSNMAIHLRMVTRAAPRLASNFAPESS